MDIYEYLCIFEDIYGYIHDLVRLGKTIKLISIINLNLILRVKYKATSVTANLVSMAT
jgi:hypothetical protein